MQSVTTKGVGRDIAIVEGRAEGTGLRTGLAAQEREFLVGIVVGTALLEMERPSVSLERPLQHNPR